jgi:hypothetical protein
MLTKDQLGKDPLREDQLTRRAALLIAEGKKTDKEIARDLGVSLETLRIWKNSPLFQEHVAAMGDEIHERSMQSIIDDVMSDAPTNIRFVKDVRDGNFTDKKDRMDIRLRASKMLLDKQVPNPNDGVSDDAVKLVIGAKLMGQMVRAMKNSGAVEVDAIDVTPETQAVTPEHANAVREPRLIVRRNGEVIDED